MSTKWYDEFNSTFWLTLAGALFAFGGVVLQAILKSRCVEFRCFGVSCVREPLPADADVELDTSELQSTSRV